MGGRKVTFDTRLLLSSSLDNFRGSGAQPLTRQVRRNLFKGEAFLQFSSVILILWKLLKEALPGTLSQTDQWDEPAFTNFPQAGTAVKGVWC